ncbi:uncharacterized protein LOC144347540 [Saccoglossus kowalevskii]
MASSLAMHAVRKVPFIQLGKLETKLEVIETRGAISKVEKSMNWVNSLVVLENRTVGDAMLPSLQRERRSPEQQQDEELRISINTDVCAPQHPYPCVDRSYCLFEDLLCDGFTHCRDSSDEMGCGKIVNKAYVKESICGYSHPYLCIDRSWCLYTNQICNGAQDCDDGSDEVDCDSETGNQDVTDFTPFHTKVFIDNEVCGYNHQYLCVDGSLCIYEYMICNGNRDCDDGTDEVDCDNDPIPTKPYLALGLCNESTPILCVDGSYCIPERLMCSGIAECLDYSDEIGCDYAEYYGEGDGNCLVPRNIGNTGWNDLAQQLLGSHNYFRCLHGVPPLRWGGKLEKFAKDAANSSAELGSELTHSHGQFAENLAFAGRDSLTLASGFGIIKQWYDEIQFYDYDSPNRTEAVGHFIIMMWESYRKVGCGVATGPDGFHQVACHYSGARRGKTLEESIKRPKYTIYTPELK